MSFFAIYSLLKAFTGSIFAAALAGNNPDINVNSILIVIIISALTIGSDTSV